MNQLIELLERIDAFFKDRKQTESYFIMALPILVIGYLALDVIIPSTTQTYENAKQKMEKTTDEIAALERELNALTVNGDRMFKVKALEKEIGDLEKSTASFNDASAYIDSQMIKVSDILFNKNTWSDFLDSISQRAKSNNLTVQSIHNEFISQEGEFGHVLEIGVNGSASFNNMLNFLANVEQSELLVDVYAMDLNATHDINGSFQISVWGFSQ